MIGWNDLSPAVTYASDFAAPPGGGFGPRIIKDHQLILAVSGKGSAVIQDNRYDVNKGDLFYYGPDVVHAFRADEEEPFVLYGIHFEWQAPLPAHHVFVPPDIFPADPRASPAGKRNEFAVRAERGEDALVLRDKTTVPPERFAPLFARIIEAFRKQREFTPLYLRALMIELLVALAAARPDIGEHPHSGVPVRDVAERLRNNAAQRYNRNWLAEWTSYHPDYVSRVFRGRTGLSPYQYFMNEKLELAKHALIHTDEPLDRLAERLGIASVHAFANWFKEQTGLPPGQYRKWNRMV